MNIAYIVPGLKNKGPVLVVKELVDQMVKNGHHCVVFYFDDVVELSFSCSVSQISFFHPIAFEEYEVVHTHGIRPDAYAFFHRRSGSDTKFISTLHNYVLRDLTFQYNRVVACVFGNLWMMLLLKRHDLIVALSKDAMHYYERWFKLSHLTYAYNTRSLQTSCGLDSEEAKQIIDFKHDSVLIGVNALLTYRKGIDMLIRALVKLPGYRLFVVGEGKAKSELYQLAKKCGVDDRVLFAGYHKDAYRYLSYYDVFAIPSRSEGFPLALLEASVVGVPVVCSDISVLKELYTTNEVSFFELENTSSLVSAVLYATDNRSLSQAIYSAYINKYCPEMFYKRYLDIYQSLL